MTVVVFVGPSVAVEDAQRVLDAVYRPPAAQGDVYRAARQRPHAIGLVDGYFERVPAVFHKEILWAMSQGVHVFGSASMGALRAAELAAFGMQGVGRIFEAYRDGRLEADDEVAVAHAGDEDRHVALSEAMVNIRATLAAASQAQVIGDPTHDGLVEVAADLFYPDRSYPAVLRRGRERGLAGGELDALERWLPAGRVDQKRADALEMLAALREHAAAAQGRPKTVTFSFEHTDLWDRVQRASAAPTATDGHEPQPSLSRILEELALAGGYARVWQEAAARVLALEESRRRGAGVQDEALAATAIGFRRRHGLFDPEDVTAWLADNGLDHGEFERLLRDEVRVRGVLEAKEAEITSAVADVVRLRGDFARLAARARDKHQALDAGGLDHPAVDDVSDDELMSWYFHRRLGRAVPADVDAFARRAGFANLAAFRQALRRERAFAGTRSALSPSDTRGMR